MTCELILYDSSTEQRRRGVSLRQEGVQLWATIGIRHVYQSVILSGEVWGHENEVGACSYQYFRMLIYWWEKLLR